MKDPSNRGSGLGGDDDDVVVPILHKDKPSLSEVAASQAADPGPEPPKKQVKKVIVIGAGISGLRAASVLQRHGIEVIILEGRDRIGGRIHTTRDDQGVPRDIGQSITYANCGCY